MGCWREGGGRGGSTTNIWNLEKTKHNCCYTGRRKALTWTAVDSLKPPHPIKVKQTSSPLGFQAVWDVLCRFSLFNVTRTSLDWNSGRELEKLNLTFHSKKTKQTNKQQLCPVSHDELFYIFFFSSSFVLSCCTAPHWFQTDPYLCCVLHVLFVFCVTMMLILKPREYCWTFEMILWKNLNHSNRSIGSWSERLRYKRTYGRSLPSANVIGWIHFDNLWILLL